MSRHRNTKKGSSYLKKQRLSGRTGSPHGFFWCKVVHMDWFCVDEASACKWCGHMTLSSDGFICSSCT